MESAPLTPEGPMSPSSSARPLASTVLVLAGAGAGLFLQRGFAAPAPAPELEPAHRARESARELSRAFQDVARDVSQAVVSVQAVEAGGGRGRLRMGSGVILRPDGVAVTNYHVIRDTTAVTVVLVDGRRRGAEVVGTDPESDLAVLRIEGGSYVSAPLEAERQPEIGEWVLAIGNPQGLSHSVTAGIISARGRTDLDLTTFEDFLQTDAAINPGNSGGPLVDLDGRIVGINTAMGTEDTGGSGLGFAIPGEIVRFVVDGILREGRVRRGFLGVLLEPLSAAEALRRGYDRSGLVEVTEVYRGTPAERVGLAIEDVILTLEGREIDDPQDLINRVAELGPGTEVELGVLRGGGIRQVPVTLGERKPRPAPELR